LVVAHGNPARIGSVGDLRKTNVRVATRQAGSGSALLLSKLIADAGVAPEDLRVAGTPVSSETDLVVRRVEYFDPPLQRLLGFARTEPFAERAASLGGYDIANAGTVVFNGRR